MGFSRRKYLPVLNLNFSNYTFPFWDYNIVKTIERSKLKLNDAGIGAFHEVLKIGKYYLPPFSLEGLVVLDLGACCGETAWYFLQHGARKVICIECEPERIAILEENKRNLKLNIEVIGEKFAPEHLSIRHDFIKCDIEGGEIDLLPFTSTLKPCVLEVHGKYLVEEFGKRGFQIVQGTLTRARTNREETQCLMINYSSVQSKSNTFTKQPNQSER